MTTPRKIRTRFAPSPTGYLHVGGARTALYSWLYARHAAGEVVLRIEDTDLERSTPEAIAAILEGLTWLGLDWDHGPFFQTKRFNRYHEVIEQMLAAGTAYRCDCSRERLETLREGQMATQQKPRYDGCCRDKPAEHALGRPHVVRFRNPLSGEVTFDDLIRGPITVANRELDDLIIRRSDGAPTYNFCVVVDDWEMEITHVIRGEDHINNTPRQINILQALGAEVPKYAHVSMIMGDDGKKLSKRHGAVGVMQYRDDGYLPQALLNYLVRLGWSHGDQEIFSLTEMQQYFTLDAVSRSASAFNTEKLQWVNHHYLNHLPVEEVATHLYWHLDAAGIDWRQGPPLHGVIMALRERSKTLCELAQQSRYFYEAPQTYDTTAQEKHLTSAALEPLRLLLELSTAATDWEPNTIQTLLQQTAAQLSLNMGKVGMPLRVALTGGTQSPSLDITMALLGKVCCQTRIETALNTIMASRSSP